MTDHDADTAPQHGVSVEAALREMVLRLRGALERSERDNAALRDSLADKRLVDSDFARMQARLLESEREKDQWKALAEERGEKLKSATSGLYTPVSVEQIEAATNPPPKLPKGIREEYEAEATPTPKQGTRWRR